jgi:hypothetical protein
LRPELARGGAGLLRALGDHFAVFPDIERRSIYPRCTPGTLAGPEQRMFDTRSKLRIPVGTLAIVRAFGFHGPDSISFGGLLRQRGRCSFRFLVSSPLFAATARAAERQRRYYDDDPATSLRAVLSLHRHVH